jgi:heat-inducible transcriptional repressor
MIELNDRQRRILARLVVEYIEQGEPVSSGWLAEHSALGLSSATVRSILVRLEEQGLVRQRHTSAGRVPTDSGYRIYVDGLLGARRPSRAMPEIEARLRQAATVGDLLEEASHYLSRASHHVGFALTPSGVAARLRHIDFVRLDSRRILVVVIASGGQITRKVVDPDEPYDDTMLTQAANYVNTEFAGLTLQEIRTAIVDRMRHERLMWDALMARALQLAQAGLEDIGNDETVFVQGTSYLLDDLLERTADGGITLETMRALVRMLEEKQRLLGLLAQYVDAPGLTVVIGSEHTTPDLQSFSLVASTFTDGESTVAVGLIGPTRMRYQRAISVVDGMSAAVSRVFAAS